MIEKAIETHALRKEYNGFVAVDSLDLEVQQGEVFGLLGPNGSGKTTTILMLLGLTEPSSGESLILGNDPRRNPLAVKALVGYMPDQVGFYEDLTARENLAFIAKLIGIPQRDINGRITKAIEGMGLSEAVDNKVKTFSLGMQRRLGLAELLLKEPKIIILDEPTAGLDPDGARQFLKLIVQLRQEGITILLSSHLLDQVQQVCDRVALFHRGRVVLQGTVTDLAQQVIGSGYLVRLRAEGESKKILSALKEIPGTSRVTEEWANVYSFASEQDASAAAARAVIDAGGNLRSLNVNEPRLDEVYRTYFERAREEAHV